MTDKLNINQWAEEDRPREKMTSLGADALSSAELLAILIGSGSTKESAVDLMKRIMADCNNSLNTLGKMSVNDLCQYNGVGPAKAITILAACELGKRRQMETPEERPDLGTATRIYNHMRPVMQDLDVEEFWVLFLNQQYQLIKKLRIARGGITATTVDIRLIIREAVLCKMPGDKDDKLTISIIKACQLMDIRFADHVIITDGHYYSYREEKRI